jgi:hypothetical protein
LTTLESWFDVAMRCVLGGMFAFAAVAKTWHVDRFSVLLAYLLHRPASDGPALVAPSLALAAWEAFLGVAVVLVPTSRLIRVCILLTLACFTAILVALLLDPRHPSCGCFGAVLSGRHEAPLGLVRNIAAAMLTISLGALQREKEAQECATETPSRSSSF